MFEHEDVECLLDKVAFKKNGETEIAECTLKISPFGPDLAEDVGHDIADRLFRFHENGPVPVSNVPLISFQEGIPAQHISWKTAPDVRSRSLWRFCTISGLKAKKAFKDQVSWTFYFKVTFDLEDKATPGELVSMLNSSLFLSFEDAEEYQQKLFDQARGQGCKAHDNPPVYLAGDGSVYCEICKPDDPELMKIPDTE